MKSPEYFMSLALKQAKKAGKIDEVPIGCVIVIDDRVVARGFNHREKKNLVISHAEIEAITKANKKFNDWRFENADLYVTLEPCIMCAGAIIQCRFRNVYFGARDFKGGAFGSSINVLESKNINHYPTVISGILEKECSEIISNYFKNKRKRK